MARRGFFSAIAAAIMEALFGESDEAEETTIDFDAEGIKLLASRLNVNRDHLNPSQPYHHVDLIWRSKKTKAGFFCGDHHAAEDGKLLSKMGISHIVNCTSPAKNTRGELPNYLEDTGQGFVYYNFPVRQ